jgi:uncharacterized protein YycO
MKKIVSSLLAMMLCIIIIANQGHFSAFAKQTDSLSRSSYEHVVISESSLNPLTIRCSSLELSGTLFSNFRVEANTTQTIVPENYAMYTQGLFDDIFNAGVGYRYSTTTYSRADDSLCINDYSEKTLNASGRSISCGSVVGASGNVSLSSQLLNNYGNIASIFSLNCNIKINADKAVLSGLIYAPNGVVEINANEFQFEGIIIADEVVICANKVKLAQKNVGFDIELYTLDSNDDFNEDIFTGTEGSSSGTNSKYYYNTRGGYPNQTTYKKYKLNEKVKVGDIVYEACGANGITGHIAVVYEICTHYNINYSTGQCTVAGLYVNVIEAISEGVCISLLDDRRFDDRQGTVLRYNSLTSGEWNDIRYFLKKQLNKPYSLGIGRRNTSIDSKKWYCSELAWAAYYYAGINLEPGGFSNFGVGVTPRDIKRSGKLKVVVER